MELASVAVSVDFLARVVVFFFLPQTVWNDLVWWIWER